MSVDNAVDEERNAQPLQLKTKTCSNLCINPS